MSKILVVDDNDIELEILNELLTLQGYEVVELKSGHSITTIVEAIKPFCILLDVHMSYKSGIEIFKELQSFEKTKNIPVIFLTGDKDLEDVCFELTEDKDLFFTKSVKWDILSIIIKEKERGSIAKNQIQEIQNQLKDIIDKLVKV